MTEFTTAYEHHLICHHCGTHTSVFSHHPVMEFTKTECPMCHRRGHFTYERAEVDGPVCPDCLTYEWERLASIPAVPGKKALWKSEVLGLPPRELVVRYDFMDLNRRTAVDDIELPDVLVR